MNYLCRFVMESPDAQISSGNIIVQETYLGQPSSTYEFKDLLSGFSKQTFTKTRSLLLFAKQAFLPVGYPYSVSEDYTEYQIWDTIQVCFQLIISSFDCACYASI